MANEGASNNKTKMHSKSEDQMLFLRRKLETFRVMILHEFEKRMSSMIDDILQDLGQREQLFNYVNGTMPMKAAALIDENRRKIEMTYNSNANVTRELTESLKKQISQQQQLQSQQRQRQQKRSKGEPRVLPVKIFMARESYLTTLLEVEDMKPIYHIFYIILIMFLLNSICHDYIVGGRINFGLGTFKAGLYKIHWVFGVWCVQHIFAFALYFAFRGWSLVCFKLTPQCGLRRFWSHSCLIVYISSQLIFAYVASSLCLRFNLPFVSASVLLLESTRLLMKMHAFVRYNVPRVLKGKLKSSRQPKRFPVPVPAFSCYLYFLFAPTLIYRDAYPRTTHIRWKFALNRLLEIILVAFLYSFIHERHIRASFQNYGLVKFDAAALVVKLFGMVLPSAVIFLCGFYLILHSWLNFTAELLRFADRMFYKDWWTSHTYDGYYRSWNVVVHDWLYEYIYKDCYTYIFKGSKVAASLMVFIISALVHEQVLGFALQLFFPVMFVLFGMIGVLLVFLMRRAPKNLGNIFIWFSLILGSATLISLYSMEYYARHNCVQNAVGMHNWWAQLIPAIWNCYRS